MDNKPRRMRKDYFESALPFPGGKMKQQVVAVVDKKTGLYTAPHMVLHPGEAIRAFAAVKEDKSPNNQFAKTPEDFRLVHIGEFDMLKGTYENLNPQVELA